MVAVGPLGYTLSSQAVGNEIPLSPPRSANLSPGIFVTLSAGASLTYSVECSGDGINWNTLDTAGAQTASGNWTLLAAVNALRLNVTAYTSGSATIRVVSW